MTKTCWWRVALGVARLSGAADACIEDAAMGFGRAAWLAGLLGESGRLRPQSTTRTDAGLALLKSRLTV